MLFVARYLLLFGGGFLMTRARIFLTFSLVLLYVMSRVSNYKNIMSLLWHSDIR